MATILRYVICRMNLSLIAGYKILREIRKNKLRDIFLEYS